MARDRIAESIANTDWQDETTDEFTEFDNDNVWESE